MIENTWSSLPTIAFTNIWSPATAPILIDAKYRVFVVFSSRIKLQVICNSFDSQIDKYFGALDCNIRWNWTLWCHFLCYEPNFVLSLFRVFVMWITDNYQSKLTKEIQANTRERGRSKGSRRGHYRSKGNIEQINTGTIFFWVFLFSIHGSQHEHKTRCK